MNTNNIELSKLLSEKGLKPTLIRLKILRYLRESMNHPTADVIFQNLLKNIPTISKTTVYNTIKSFLEKGIVMPVNITGTEIRIDLNTFCHHHFLCESCGAIFDININCPNIKKGEIDGNQVKEVHGYFKGICKKCRKTERNLK